MHALNKSAFLFTRRGWFGATNFTPMSKGYNNPVIVLAIEFNDLGAASLLWKILFLSLASTGAVLSLLIIAL